MPTVDFLWMTIGFFVGVVTAGFAVELGLKKLLSPPDSSKLTNVWSLTELPTPLIVATQIQDLALPKTAKLVTARALQVPRDGFEVRTNAGARANFAVDATLPRALIFLSGIEKGTMALWTVDERLIERLRAEFNRLWTHSTDYVERVRLAEIPQKANLTVSTQGTVQGVVPYKGQYLVRLSDEGETVGVLVDREVHMTGTRVEVVGVVKTSSSGFPLVEAIEIRQPGK